MIQEPSPRTKYSREIRDNLRKILGGKCAHCPATESLQFDCIVSQGGEHHEMQWRSRLNFYWQEHHKKNLQLLCPPCHVAKTLREIAARQLHEHRITCPRCAHIFRLAAALRLPPPPEAALT